MMSSPSTLPPAPRGTSATAPDRRDPVRDLGVRRAARSGCRRRGRPCSRCPGAGCGWRSPSRRPTHPSSRIANASSGVGSGRGSTSALRAGAGHHLGGVAGEDVGVVAGVVPDHDGAALAAPWSMRYAASPAAARSTTTRFIRFGPAPSAPRSPAVPNSSVPSNRSARSAGSAAVRDVGDDRVQLGPGLLVRVLRGPRTGAFEQGGNVRGRHGVTVASRSSTWLTSEIRTWLTES